MTARLLVFAAASRLARLPRALALGAALLPGCAWITQNQAATATYEHEVMVAQIRAQELEAVVAEDETRIAQLEEAVRRFGASESSRLENIDQINTEISRLRGQIEELRFQVQEMQKFLDDSAIERERRMLHAERRLAAIETYLKIKPPPPPTDAELGVARDGTAGGSGTPADPGGAGGSGGAGGAGGTDGGAGAIQTPATAKEKLELAVQHMKEDRQAIARVILEKAIEEHPGAPELAVIRYRLGETYFNERDYKRAARAFQSVIDNHGSSDWAAWAMFRQGECFDQLSQSTNAQLFYESVVAKYPRSEAAKEARKHLPK